MSHQKTALPFIQETALPFIYARLSNPEVCSKEYKPAINGDVYTVEPTIKDWMVIIAYPDFVTYDARWQCDEVVGDYVLIPDVDIAICDDTIFPTLQEARKYVKEWWANNN